MNLRIFKFFCFLHRQIFLCHTTLLCTWLSYFGSQDCSPDRLGERLRLQTCRMIFLLFLFLILNLQRFVFGNFLVVLLFAYLIWTSLKTRLSFLLFFEDKVIALFFLTSVSVFPPFFYFFWNFQWRFHTWSNYIMKSKMFILFHLHLKILNPIKPILLKIFVSKGL